MCFLQNFHHAICCSSWELHPMLWFSDFLQVLIMQMDCYYTFEYFNPTNIVFCFLGNLYHVIRYLIFCFSFLKELHTANLAFSAFSRFHHTKYIMFFFCYNVSCVNVFPEIFILQYVEIFHEMSILQYVVYHVLEIFM